MLIRYSAEDRLATMRRRADLISSTLAGVAGIAVVMFVASYQWNGEWIVWRATGHDIRLLSNHGAFCLQRIDPNGTVYPAIFGLPYLVPAIVFALAAAARVVLRRALVARRVRAGRCGVCGYDLRASRGRCPECGTCSSGGSPVAAQPDIALDRPGGTALGTKAGRCRAGH